jgi:hypothetical protein
LLSEAATCYLFTHISKTDVGKTKWNFIDHKKSLRVRTKEIIDLAIITHFSFRHDKFYAKAKWKKSEVLGAWLRKVSTTNRTPSPVANTKSMKHNFLSIFRLTALRVSHYNDYCLK